MQEFYTKKEILKKYAAYEIVYLGIGQVVYSKKPVLIHTVLGSCLAVVLYNENFKIGAICHAQTPTKLTKEKCFQACPLKCLNELPVDNKYKYVSCSINYMLHEFKKSKIAQKELVAKLAGGAKVLAISQYNGKQITVGEENALTAEHLLDKNSIKINAREIGGEKGRVLYYFTGDNSLYLTTINDKNYGKFRLI